MKTPEERADEIVALRGKAWAFECDDCLRDVISRAIREAVVEDREARETDQRCIVREVPLAGLTGTIERLEAAGWIVDNPRVLGMTATIRARPGPKA